jgi:putative tricarboxylic transport membrane protein
MWNTFAAIVEAWQSLATGANCLYIVLGGTLGVIFGVIPGLTAPILLSLLIPITIGMGRISSMLLLGAALGGTTFAGSITAILFGIPGTANNIATTLDGYPLGKQGRGAEAIACAASSSVFGCFFGYTILILLVPVMIEVVGSFGPPEIFWVVMVGIFLISIASRQSVFKGLLSGAFGLLLSTHGFSSATGFVRFTFGVNYLWNGFKHVPITLGIFGLAELTNMIVTRNAITNSKVNAVNKEGILRGLFFPWKHITSCIRGGIIGMLVGIIPGAGAGIADSVAYVAEKKASRHPETFGTGEMLGVVAPESSNNAKDCGAMLPMLSFGVPGSLATAILMGSFELHGLQPGPKMFLENLPVSMLIIMAVLFGGLLSCVIGILGLPVWKYLNNVPISYMYIMLTGISALACYGSSGDIRDVCMAFVCGILGYFMIRYNFSRVALMLGLVLGPTAEANYLRSLQISAGSFQIFFRNWICLALISLMVIYSVGPGIKKWLNRLISPAS